MRTESVLRPNKSTTRTKTVNFSNHYRFISQINEMMPAQNFFSLVSTNLYESIPEKKKKNQNQLVNGSSVIKP